MEILHRPRNWHALTDLRRLAAKRARARQPFLHQQPCLRRYHAADQSKKRPKVAMFFPGQGVQRVGMLGPWLESFPQIVKPIMEETDELLQTPLSRIIEQGPNSLLNRTENAQPAILAVSIACLRVFEQHFGFDTSGRVDYVFGHSLGEFAALVAGEYLQSSDALKMVRMRGEVSARCSEEARREVGDVGMVALLCEPERLDDMIASIHEFLGYGSSGSKQDSSEVPPVQQVLIANINSKNQVVLSGPLNRIKTLLANLREFGGHDPRAVQIKSETPFHSPLMQPAQDAMHRFLRHPENEGKEDIVKYPGAMPCISNVTAQPFQSSAELKDLLARSCVETVQWWDSIKYLDQEAKVRRWIGLGPGKVGRNLVGKEVGMKGAVKGGGVWGISMPRECEEAINGLDATEFVEEED